MQNLKIDKGFLKSEIKIPTSKSYANRALILAALSEKKITLKDLPQATDVTILIDCFKQVGLKVVTEGDLFSVVNSFPDCEKNMSELILEVGEGGTTARFLATMLLLGEKEYTLKLGNRLKMRPWDEFLKTVYSLGGRAQLVDSSLIIQGPIKMPLNLEIDCSETTQYASAFKMISHFTKTEVTPINMTSSISYWDLTQKMISEVLSQESYQIPCDWSSASYPMAFAALNQKIIFPGLYPDPFQADSKFFDILNKGGWASLTENGVKVEPSQKKYTCDLDVSDALDLVPTLAFFLAHIDGKHTLRGIRNLIHKESNRLTEVMSLLNLFHRNTNTDGETLWIEGHTEILEKAVNVSLPNDHRMVMVAALFLLHHSGGSLKPAEAVNKSFPGFFDLIEKKVDQEFSP